MGILFSLTDSFRLFTPFYIFANIACPSAPETGTIKYLTRELFRVYVWCNSPLLDSGIHAVKKNSKWLTTYTIYRLLPLSIFQCYCLFIYTTNVRNTAMIFFKCPSTKFTAFLFDFNAAWKQTMVGNFCFSIYTLSRFVSSFCRYSIFLFAPKMAEQHYAKVKMLSLFRSLSCN